MCAVCFACSGRCVFLVVCVLFVCVLLCFFLWGGFAGCYVQCFFFVCVVVVLFVWCCVYCVYCVCVFAVCVFVRVLWCFRVCA